MFNRKQISYHDKQIVTSEDLARFNNDAYLTRYLLCCYNPEFKIRKMIIHDKPRMLVHNLNYVFNIVPGRPEKYCKKRWTF